jgi:putative Mn2+ efflux pump MntP
VLEAGGLFAQATAAEEKAKQAADAAATFSIFAALSMLIGAFIASVAAAYGGSLRDDLDARRE